MVDKAGNSFEETLRGTAAADRLYGLGASDRLLGRDGDDQLYGDEFPPFSVIINPILVIPDNDTLIGGNGNDRLYGNKDSDRLIGGAGDDWLVGGVGGVQSSFSLSGAKPRGEVDRLSGGEGRDTFVLGNAKRAFYASTPTLRGDRDDYALINDFTDGEDTIQLNAGVKYKLEATTLGKVSGIGIYVDRPGTRSDELIGIVKGGNLAELNLSSVPIGGTIAIT